MKNYMGGIKTQIAIKCVQKLQDEPMKKAIHLFWISLDI